VVVLAPPEDAGIERRLLAATITWQPSRIASVGVLFDEALGVALGPWRWTLFARQIGAVPVTDCP